MPQSSRLCACHVQTPVQHDHVPNHFLLSQAMSQEKPFQASQKSTHAFYQNPIIIRDINLISQIVSKLLAMPSICQEND